MAHVFKARIAVFGAAFMQSSVPEPDRNGLFCADHVPIQLPIDSPSLSSLLQLHLPLPASRPPRSTARSRRPAAVVQMTRCLGPLDYRLSPSSYLTPRVLCTVYSERWAQCTFPCVPCDQLHVRVER